MPLLLRRDFLRAAAAASAGGAIGTTAMLLRGTSGAGASSDAPGRSCILIRMDGGASHVDTFDVKPSVSPFAEIRTSVPGIRICEHLPLTARLAGKYTIVRSMHSSDTNHERARLQLRFGDTPITTIGEGIDTRYGDTAMGRDFHAARQMVEAGARVVTVTGGRLRWDTHAANAEKLRDELLPEFDRAFSSLLLDLEASGLLATTLVVVTGEFGRTPRLNDHAGRDHHAHAWSALIAGAGVPGGRVVGATDRTGEEVTDTPVEPRDLLRLVATVLEGRRADMLT